MIGAGIVKTACCLEGETKGASRRQVPAIKRPVVTGNGMDNRRGILPDNCAAYPDSEKSRAEVGFAEHDHNF